MAKTRSGMHSVHSNAVRQWTRTAAAKKTKQFSSSIPTTEKNQSAFNNVVCRHLLRGGCHGVRWFPLDPRVAEERLPSQGHLPRPQQGRMAEGLRPDRFAGAPLSHPDTPGLAIKSFFAVSVLKKIIDLPGGQINDPSLRKYYSLSFFLSLVSVSDPWGAFWADTAPFKGPQGYETETSELLGGTEEINVSPTRGHWFALQANQ